MAKTNPKYNRKVNTKELALVAEIAKDFYRHGADDTVAALRRLFIMIQDEGHTSIGISEVIQIFDQVKVNNEAFSGQVTEHVNAFVESFGAVKN